MYPAVISDDPAPRQYLRNPHPACQPPPAGSMTATRSNILNLRLQEHI
ncbi:hypothetical protein L579_4309 [Pantoea sp. AS-PWVM4]|nr:hypothetical protein L579_4309 [Pantoea sp. AS-PWVM4]